MSYQISLNIDLECIEKEELLERMNSSSGFVIVDTIGNFNGNKYKIKGSITIPYPEVADRRKELQGYSEIIVYCKDKKCIASKKAASALQLLKVSNVKVYEGGIDEWTESGLPVEEE